MNNVETPKKKPRCQFISKIGSRCHADPQTGRDWCFMHDPDQKKKQAEACPGEPRAQKHGGETRTRQISPEITLPPNLPDLPLNNAYDVRQLTLETMHHLRCRTMDLRAARAIGYLAAIHLRALTLNYRLVALIMAETINQFRSREMDLPTAKTFGMLASVTLCAIKQEAEESEAAGIAMTEAAQPVQAVGPDASHPDRTAAVVRRIAAVQAQEDHKVHPAILDTPKVSTASQPLSS